MACGTICTHGVTKRFGEVAAVLESELCVDRGEFVALLGPSGCGKTTLLRLVAGFERPDAGEIAIEDRPVFGPGVFVPSHARGIGMVFQEYALFPHLSVEQNVGFGVRRGDRRERVPELLRLVGLTQHSQRFPHELSGGQQQRVALARAIVFDPPLLLMDEPLGALDKKLREWLQLEIKRIHRELGTTFVYVTHDQEEALVLSDRIAVFNQGRIEQIGTGRQLYDEPETLFVGKFVGDSTILRGAASTSGNETVIEIEGRKVAAAKRLPDGAKPVMLLRPEKLSLARRGKGEEDRNTLPGRIGEAIYLGSGSKYEVVLADTSKAIVRSTLDAETFAIGDEVDLIFAGSDVKLLADDEKADFTLT
jgi:putative spermidine/putrescine transport system ATP-binding protein